MNFKYCHKQYANNSELALDNFLDYFMQFIYNESFKKCRERTETTSSTS